MSAKPLYQSTRLVSRTVVNDNHVFIRPIYRESAFDRLTNELTIIIAVYYDGKAHVSHGPCLRCDMAHELTLFGPAATKRLHINHFTLLAGGASLSHTERQYFHNA
jgi:hypothetical protein